MTTPDTYSLDELADKSGIEPRTIRSYVSKGLLPRPSRGRSAQYEANSLDRLLAIKRLIDETGCGLDYCRTLLESFDDDYIASIASGQEQIRVIDPHPPATRSSEIVATPMVRVIRSTECPPPSVLSIPDSNRWIHVPIGDDVRVHIKAEPEQLTQQHADRIIRLVREIVEDAQSP